MENEHDTNTTLRESLMQLTTNVGVLPTNPDVKNELSGITRDMTETGDGGRAEPVKRERVYLHSIGRFSRLRRLQIRGRSALPCLKTSKSASSA